tara:strand:- start:1702 stop:3258 length:1557 start_codon:yes stop_codon:yes gene_type:complete
MSAVVTDQFRIDNANNFIDSVLNTSNSYYVFLGLPNPISAGFGRTTTGWPSNPIDNFDYQTHYKDTMMFGKKINSTNIRRVVKKNTWVTNTRYDMYRHDYNINFEAPNSSTSNLYRSKYYVINSDFQVYICIDNGSTGKSGTTSAKGEVSSIEPNFTDVEPVTLSDGYTWKYLYTVSPSDIIKFDSIEYMVLPNNWSTSTDAQIKNIRNAGNSDINKNQIKKVYIEDGGSSYSGPQTQTCNILGDGEEAKVSVTVDRSGQITSTKVVSGGYGYTYGIVDLSPIQTGQGGLGKLIPIIPPSKGHGYDLYKELGADKVLIYARFDDSTKDYPVDTSFAQVGILKNPLKNSSSDLHTANEFSSLDSFKISEELDVNKVHVGVKITQGSDSNIARGYVASYDEDTKIVKYFKDRSLFYANGQDQSDNIEVSSLSKVLKISSSGGNITFKYPSGDQVKALDTTLSGITTTSNNKIVNLGVSYTNGVAEPEINKKTGEIIYISNRTTVKRDLRQKEDVKIVLEF